MYIGSRDDSLFLLVTRHVLTQLPSNLHTILYKIMSVRGYECAIVRSYSRPLIFRPLVLSYSRTFLSLNARAF
jgi:hypothetical protein